jgi:hypothetical protein
VQDDVWDIVPGLEGQLVPSGSSRSTFHARESVDVCSIGQALSHKFKCLYVWKLSKAFNHSNLL